MMKKTLTFHIEEKAETLQEGTFKVPSGCLTLTFVHDLDEAFAFLVFLLIRDPQGNLRLQKQLAHGEPVISLGQNGMDTTIGGVPGSFPEGEWTVQICLFAEHLDRIMSGKKVCFSVTVSDEKAKITEQIGPHVWTRGSFAYEKYEYDRLYEKACRWYKGDFHTHTRLSDGKETTWNATQKAEKDELDYYVPTEHNVVHTGWQDTDVMILPGVEMTTILGHANLFGLTGRPEGLTSILSDKEPEKLKMDIEAMIQECREKGWLFSVNHPFLYIWKWLYGDLKLADMNCLEIINDPTYAADEKAHAEEANQKAVYLSDLLWADGYRICAVGGSDSHNLLEERYGDAMEPSVPGDPATYVYMDGMSPEHLLDALKRCHVYVTRHCSVENVLEADGRPVLFGDQLPYRTGEIQYEFRFLGLSEEPDVFFIENGERHSCSSVMEKDGIYRVKGTIKLSRCDYTWIRFGAETKDGRFLFYANPVTTGCKTEHKFITFEEVKTCLEGCWKDDQRNSF